MTKERIDKLLAHQGFGSRKDIKKLLHREEVLVNNKQIFDAGFLINVDSDSLFINGEQIFLRKEIYLMMNKIKDTVSANKDGEHQTVFDYLEDDFRTPYMQEKLHLVGRLDIDTEGLLLLTTDGALTHRLISPKSHVSKTYFVLLEHTETLDHKQFILQEFEKGITIPPEDNDGEAVCKTAQIQWLSKERAAAYLEQSTWKEDSHNIQNLCNNDFALLTIYEGKYHQVKRMFRAVENKVIYLKRISIGSLFLDDSLKPGDYKTLNQEDIEKLV